MVLLKLCWFEESVKEKNHNRCHRFNSRWLLNNSPFNIFFQSLSSSQKDKYQTRLLFWTITLSVVDGPVFRKLVWISAYKFELCCFSTKCIVWIKPLKICLPVHPHSAAFKVAIALYYFIILIHTNVQWLRFSVNLHAKTSRVTILKSSH